ncbi:hypothetical protein NQZ68_019867 [Dissostichus eleginoides]|nr:hypothetical protein NQZ68_019867 [Dissostichus eleginoides]
MVTQALRQGHSHRLSSSLAFCKAQGIQSSKATPLCTSAVLDSEAGRQGEGPIWGPAVRALFVQACCPPKAGVSAIGHSHHHPLKRVKGGGA